MLVKMQTMLRLARRGCSMKYAFLGFFATSWLMLAALAQSPPVPKLPDTPKRSVTDEYQGIKVTDDYRWLENWDDPESKQWSAAENAYSRNYLDSLPARTAIKERLRQLISESSSRYFDLKFRGGMLFA